MIDLKLVSILQKLFAFGGNHNIDECIKIKNEFLDFIIEDNLFLKHQYEHNENYMMAINGIRFIDANNAYAVTSNRAEGYFHMKPFFEHLLKSDTWHYYELHLLINSIYLCETIEQALELAGRAVAPIAKFRDNIDTDILEGYLALNICAIIFNAKFHDNSLDCMEEFNAWFSKLEELAEINQQLEVPFLVTQIRHAFLNQDQEPEQFAKLFSELSVDDEEIEKAIKNEIDNIIQ